MGTMESGEELMGGNEERIHVSVRLRPLNAKEILRNDVSDWECINDDTVVYKNVSLSASDRSMYPTAYTFDKVFRSDCSTREVYEKGAKDVAVSVLSGLNSSVFAYGQTSSGKTYTMTGVTEYAIADIYEYVKKHPERAFVLKFSAMEIYNESVRDLLSVDSTPLRLLDDPERGTIVEKLTEEILRDWDHVVQLLSVCEAQRQIGETSLNEMSSRSHQIIRLTVESTSREFLGRENASTLSAAVNFVDLAGSERASQSLSAGTRLKEGCHINRSLLTLGTVIRKLSKGRGGHIPYRDSKLTRILQTSLGGNARTAIICTMSPARSHVEQSRNTLHFASCAKEVATNAQVNVVMSDKALVKYLQRELERLESELRSPQSALAPSNYSAILREKDLQIGKLEEKICDLILQRDIAQSQVKDLLQMLGDGASRIGTLPTLASAELPDSETQERETSILADPHSLDVDTRRYSDGHSTTSSQDQIVRVPYFVEDFVQSNLSPRVLISSSNFTESYSYHGWEEIEKQSSGNSEDLCREVRCIETEDLSNTGAIESSFVCPEENTEFPEVKVYVKEHRQTTESPSTPSEIDQGFKLSPLKNDSEMKEGTGTGVVTSKEDQELILVPLEEVKQSLPPPCEKEKELSSIHYLRTRVLENLSLRHELDQDSSVVRRLKLTKSRSCKASIANSASPRFKIKDFGENTSSFGSERESVCFERKLSPLSFSPEVQSLSRNYSPFSPGNALDIEIDTPNMKFATAEDVTGSTTDMTDKAEFPTEHVFITDPSKEIEPKSEKTPKKNVKDVGLDPIGDELEGLSSWPVEFQRLQQEIIELWHACNVSLVHRTYFFMLFRGDPSDAIYLEVELRRMKFLNDKFSHGEKTIVNGRRLTLASSEKALRDERRTLSKRMMSKFSEQERESLFLKWGIGLNTKLRRQQLAQRLWSKTEDMDHIADSAFLVAKLVSLNRGRLRTKKCLVSILPLDAHQERIVSNAAWCRSCDVLD
ncbi:UNVERIFIED_CONTAM: Kinesin-like protein KIN-7H [Sesamum latifolium]|uniref:Kinesin-like protein KIN-7H n=1 Tax=Sesamum latifolium TaxID=2727402 RepID=A0AAW2X4F7_9LAMI